MLKLNISLFLLLIVSMTGLAQNNKNLKNTKIQFEVSFTEPQAHYAEVQMDIEGFKKDFIDIKMPVWTPGSYLVREYSRNVESFTAKNKNGNSVKVQKISKNTWRVFSEKADHIQVNYRLYGFEVSVRTNYIDDKHAFLSSASTFMFVDGHLDHPVEVNIKPFSTWKKVSTGLEKSGKGEFSYIAPDFDILFDSPIEVGNQEIFTFHASGVEHEVAMVNIDPSQYDSKKLSEDFTKIIEEETSIYGVNPNKRYVFIVHHFHSGGGGLEHLNSTVLGASRSAYHSPKHYNNFLGLVAHEYFHLWMVKRLRPIELGPFNYEAENYTTGLWIMEGFTSYYDNLILRRTGIYSETAYLDVLAGDFNTVENKAGNAVQPVALASMDAWIKFYRPDENSSNSSISYYNKGALLALLMDVKIIAESKGKKRLDDAIKAAYEDFYVKKNRGFKEPELEEIIKKSTGVSVEEIFKMAHTTEKIDYNFYLNKIGYELIDKNADYNHADLGITTNNTNGKLTVATVQRGSAAWDSGLNVKDEIIAINGNRLEFIETNTNFVQNLPVGSTIEVLISRDGQIRTIPVKLKKVAIGNFALQILPNANDSQKKLGEIWLSTNK